MSDPKWLENYRTQCQESMNEYLNVFEATYGFRPEVEITFEPMVALSTRFKIHGEWHGSTGRAYIREATAKGYRKPHLIMKERIAYLQWYVRYCKKDVCQDAGPKYNLYTRLQAMNPNPPVWHHGPSLNETEIWALPSPIEKLCHPVMSRRLVKAITAKKEELAAAATH